MRTRAAVIYEMEKPQPYAETRPLVIEEVELEPLSPGEVLVEIVSAGLCHSDLSTINGTIPRQLPMILGHEASGIVREVGPGVMSVKPDDHVVFSFVPTCGHCLYCAIGRPALCENGTKANNAGTLLDGGVRFRQPGGQPIFHYLGVSAYSQYTVAAQESLNSYRENNSPGQSGPLWLCHSDRCRCRHEHGPVHPGEPVVIFGLGGVGLSALMGAKLVGASPLVAVDALPAKFALAKRLGADVTVNATEGDPVAAVRDVTGGGAEYAFEAVGNANVLAQAYKATRRGGKTISIGIAHPKQQLAIQALSLVALEKTIQGSFMGSAVPLRDIPRLINLYLAGKLPVDELLSPSITLDEINEGFDRLAQGTVVRQLIQFF